MVQLMKLCGDPALPLDRRVLTVAGLGRGIAATD